MDAVASSARSDRHTTDLVDGNVSPYSFLLDPFTEPSTALSASHETAIGSSDGASLYLACPSDGILAIFDLFIDMVGSPSFLYIPCNVKIGCQVIDKN